jgi:hypothetical protein
MYSKDYSTVSYIDCDRDTIDMHADQSARAAAAGAVAAAVVYFSGNDRVSHSFSIYLHYSATACIY